MTTHTDQKSGFGSFPAKGLKPLPTEPVQIHEDPGAAYWREATKMAEHTDRIGQFLEQSGVGFVSEEFPDIWQLHMHAGRDELMRFAQLVAEDCARVADGLASFDWESAASAHRIDQAIRARYGLKDE